MKRGPMNVLLSLQEAPFTNFRLSGGPAAPVRLVRYEPNLALPPYRVQHPQGSVVRMSEIVFRRWLGQGQFDLRRAR